MSNSNAARPIQHEVDLAGSWVDYNIAIVGDGVRQSWRLPMPYGERFRREEFALALRDFLRERGFDARVVSETTLTAEVP